MVQVHVLEGAGVVSVVGGGSQVHGVVHGGGNVVDSGVVHGGNVDGGVVHGGGVGVDGVSSVVGIVGGVSLTLDGGLESVSVVLVVDHAAGSVSLDQGVVSGDGVSVALLLLLLDVSGVRVLHSVRELVVGGRVMMVVVVGVVAQAVSAVQGEDGGSGHQVVGVSVVGHLAVVSVSVALVSVTDVSGQDSGAGHGQDAQDGDESESHCCCSLVAR